jgi:broad specificity phosphatase PhoE
MAKNIYFIRHGESDANADRIHKGAHAVLTQKGRKQADSAGERFNKIPVDIIVTSSFDRAIETGKIIAKYIQKPIVDNLDILIEYEFSSETIGLHYDDERHIEVVRAIKEKFLTSKDRHSDEETFPELQRRANEVLKYLENRPEENILVVSHGRFIRFLVGHICLGDSFTPAAFNSFDRTLKSSNTGITRAELRDDMRWVIWQWNDSAHLG